MQVQPGCVPRNTKIQLPLNAFFFSLEVMRASGSHFKLQTRLFSFLKQFAYLELISALVDV